MDIKYNISESTIKQPEIEVGATTVYLRRNYAEVQRTFMEGEPPVSMWQYEEAQLTKDEALEMLTEQKSAIEQNRADIDYVALMGGVDL